MLLSLFVLRYSSEIYTYVERKYSLKYLLEGKTLHFYNDQLALVLFSVASLIKFHYYTQKYSKFGR